MGTGRLLHGNRAEAFGGVRVATKQRPEPLGPAESDIVPENLPTLLRTTRNILELKHGERS